MEKEISNGAMLGIVLIALAAIIGLGFGVFAIAKGTANDGVNNMQENLDVVGNSSFTDYDQKIVTGTQVTSALQNFEGKPYALIVSTNAIKKASKETGGVAKAPGVEQSFGTGKAQIREVVAENVSYMNYNAVLKEDTLAFDSNHLASTAGLLSEKGKIIMNNVTGNVSKSGMAEYVPSGAKFQAYLIKDESGTILGASFEQLD